MARLIKHETAQPYHIPVSEIKKDIWLCACGLSKNKPYCDGSHKRARDEEPGALYLYDDNGRIKLEKNY